MKVKKVKKKVKYKDIVECLQLQPHRFRLVEDEFEKEVRIFGKICLFQLPMEYALCSKLALMPLVLRWVA